MDSIDPQAIKFGFEMAKSAIETVKGLRDLCKTDPDAQKDISRQIALAERELAFAEAQIAQALEYKLCKAHFPPIPMLKNRIHPVRIEDIFKCPECNAEEPSPEYFARLDQHDEARKRARTKPRIGLRA